jgi:methionyl-tRNA formyltransferase
MGIVFMGTPEFAVPVLELLVANKYKITAVYTQPDKASGRGHGLSLSPVKKAALEMDLAVVQSDNFKSPAEKERLAALKPDAIIVAAYGVILPPAVLQVAPLGCINIHPSLLPKYRGVAPVPAAILKGDEFTGVSVMLLDKGVDTGPILAQAQIPVNDTDTAGLLREKLSCLGARLLLEVLPRLAKKEITPKAQDNTVASYTHLLEKADGEINWRKSANEISRHVRAYQPWPGSFTHWQGRQLKIIDAVPLEGNVLTPGNVVFMNNEKKFGVETGAGILAIETLQLEGKKVMAAAEFIRGQRSLIGALLPN